MKPRRVLLISPYALTTPGGVQAQVLGLAHTLRDRGTDARIIGPCDGPPPEPGIYSLGPSQRIDGNGAVAPISFGTEVSRRTLQLAADLEPDVIHLHEPFVPGPNHALVLAAQAPLVGTFHAAGDVPWYRRARRFATAATNQLDVVTVVSNAAAELIRGFWSGPIEIVPNGIELAPIASAPMLPSEHFVISFVGRHEERKGLETLISAYRELRTRPNVPKSSLWVVGTGPETPRLTARAGDGVRWFGAVDDATRNSVLRSSTVFAAPATGGESFGIVLIEGMAAGAVVIASNIDGYRDVVQDDRSGILVDPTDITAWADAFQRVLSDKLLRERLASGGTERAAGFALEHVTERYLACYEQAIIARRARASDSESNPSRL